MANAAVPAAPQNAFPSPLDPQPPGKWLRQLHLYFVHDENVVSKSLTRIQNAVGISKSVSLNVLLGFTMILLLFAENRIRRLVSTLLTVCYPLYSSCAVLTGRGVISIEDKFAKWLLFWTIYAVFESMEPLAVYLPFYWLCKTMFLLSLCLPPIDLCGVWVREWIKPLVYLSLKQYDRDVFLNAHCVLLKELHLERGCFKHYEEFVLKNELAKLKTQDILRSLVTKTPFRGVPLPITVIAAIALIPANFPFFN